MLLLTYVIHDETRGINVISTYPIEKILTISAREYVEMVGKELEDFTPCGVTFGADSFEYNRDMKSLASKIDEKFEVVVGLQTVLSVSAYMDNRGTKNKEETVLFIGTALIPKNKA